MSLTHFLNPEYSLGELANLRTFFWRLAVIGIVIFLCL